MTTAQLICITCKDTFKSRFDLNYHVKRHHQELVKVKFRDGRVAEVKRGDENMFKCNCGKRFGFPGSLQRHAKRCGGDVIESEEAEEEDSDASESMDFNEEFVDNTPEDCFGAQIPCENY
jgi:hypothetical protein